MKNKTYDFSSVQVTIEDALRKQLLRESMRIRSADLYREKPGYGREDDPHVTVKYGIHSTYPTEIKPYLREVDKITIKLGKVSLFSNPDSDYEVVKIDIIDKGGLRKLNRLISENLEHTDSFPEYKPHITLAYVKKGTGKNYTGNSPLTGKTYEARAVTFTGHEGNRVDMDLGETQEQFIGVDFDGTLAKYDGWKGWDKLGKPVKAMVNKVKEELKKGNDVKIFTARYSGSGRDKIKPLLAKWCENAGLPVLEVTNEKTPGMYELWDDRAKQVIGNRGIFKAASERKREELMTITKTGNEVYEDLGLIDSYRAAHRSMRMGDKHLSKFINSPELMKDRAKGTVLGGLLGAGVGGVSAGIGALARLGRNRAALPVAAGGAALGAGLGTIAGQVKGDVDYLSRKGLKPQKSPKALLGYLRANPEARKKYIDDYDGEK